MKRVTSLLVAVLLVCMLVVAAGCGKAAAAPTNIDPSSTTDQTQTTDGTQAPSTQTSPSGDATQVTPQGGTVQ